MRSIIALTIAAAVGFATLPPAPAKAQSVSSFLGAVAGAAIGSAMVAGAPPRERVVRERVVRERVVVVRERSSQRRVARAPARPRATTTATSGDPFAGSSQVTPAKYQ